MTIRVEMKDEGAVRRELRVEVDAERVGQALERVLAQIAREARIPGFRRGKVPKRLLRKRFAHEVDKELLDHLVPEALYEALAEAKLEPVHQPVIKDVSLEDGKPLAFTAAFEVRPKIEPVDYRGVAVIEPQALVEDADVERELQSLRESHAEFVPVEARKLEKGDFALVDMTTVSEGEEPRFQEGVLIEVGAEEYHPEFVKELEGAAPGDERSFQVSYAADDPDPRARGREVGYTIRVREVKRKVLPELDDELAKDTGEHETLAALRASIRTDLERRLDRERRRHLEQQLVEALVPGVNTEVPQALVEQDLDRQIEEQARMLILRGIDPRTAPIDWRATRDKLKDRATKKVKWDLLLDAIATKEGVEASDADVEARLQDLAEGAKKSVEYVRSKIEKDHRMEELRASVRLERTVDFLLRNARIEKR